MTKALLRFVHVPGLDQPAALITLDNGFDHTKPNSFGPGGLASLDAAIDRGARGRPGVHRAHRQAVHLLRRRRHHRHAAASPTREQARGARPARATGSSPGCRTRAVPTFAFVNGAAMGGGLEVALHCHYRTRRPAARPRSPCPRSRSAWSPAGAARQLLPNLIGIARRGPGHPAEPADPEGCCGPKQAAELGIADALFEPADFLERSLEWAAGVVDGDGHRRAARGRPGHVGRRALLRQAAARRAAARRGRRRANKALELLALAKDATFADGTAAEDEALADLIMGDESRASLYAFDLVQRRAKRPVGAPDKAPGPRRHQGRHRRRRPDGLASWRCCSPAGCEVPVVLTDLDQARVDKGVGYVHGRDRQAGRPRAGWTRARRPSCAAWSAARSTSPSSPTPTS